MAYYNVNQSKNFSVNNASNLLTQQVEQLEVQVEQLNISTPTTRLFLNYGSLNHDYYNQPSNMNNIGITMSPSQTQETSTVPARGSTNVDLFATIPTDLVFQNETILAGDTWTIKLWIYATQPNLSISFPIILYQSLAGPSNGMSIPLTDTTVKYPIQPVLGNSTQPILHTFTIPITTSVSTIPTIAQLIINPTLHNDGYNPTDVITYYGGQTPSYILTTMDKDAPFPNNSWVAANLEITNLTNGTMGFLTFEGPITTSIPFVELSNIGPYMIAVLNSEDAYFSDVSNYFIHIANQNVYKESNTTGSNYFLKMQDVQTPDNYALFQVGPMEPTYFTGPNDTSYMAILLSTPMVASGMLNLSSIYTMTFTTDGSNAIASFGPLIPPLTLETAQTYLSGLTNSFHDGRLENGLTRVLSLTTNAKVKSRSIRAPHMKVVKDNQPAEEMSLRAAPVKLPSKVDLRSKQQPIRDQGQLGSCTAFASCGQYGYKVPSVIGSPLFQYYNERKQDKTIPYDAGSSVTQAINVLKSYGICTEATWPYNISLFTQAPPTGAYTQASSHKVSSATRLNSSLATLKTTLSNGGCFSFGFLVYSSFESSYTSRTGIVTLPKRGEQLLGGHAVTCVGYDDANSWFIVRNSWGTGWGDQGYFYMPYTYMTNTSLCWDFWTINTAS